jgi:hypothetical protein
LENTIKDVIAINKRFGNKFYARAHKHTWRVHLDTMEMFAARYVYAFASEMLRPGIQFGGTILSISLGQQPRDDWSAIKEPYFCHLIKPSSPNYEQRVAGSAANAKAQPKLSLHSAAYLRADLFIMLPIFILCRKVSGIY